MEVCALASGSSGNSFYVGNSKSKNGILIDSGISSKRIVERLGTIGKKPEQIKAIFITHEHSDHIRGADVFARQFNVPIFATKKTASSCFLCSNNELVNTIKNNENVSISGLDIEAFSKSHKVADPVSFSVYYRNKKASIITDLGYCCNNVIQNVSDADLLCLESNHDMELLEKGPYPWFLKKWIKSDLGHLSNMQASLCVLEHASKKLKNVVLSHMSSTNNTPEIALKTFSSLIKERKDLKPRISLSLKDKPTELFKL